MLLLRRAQVLSLARLAQQPVRGEEVELLQRAIDRVVLPLGRGEALVRAARSRRLGPCQPAQSPPCLVPGVHRSLHLPHIEIGGGGGRSLWSADGPQPDRPQCPGDLRPVHRDNLAQRVRVEHVIGRAQDRVQDRVLGRHLAELLQTANELIGRHLPCSLPRQAPGKCSHVARQLRNGFDPGSPEADHHLGTRRRSSRCDCLPRGRETSSNLMRQGRGCLGR